MLPSLNELFEIALGRVALVVVLYFTTKVLWQIIYNHFLHPLAKFPGPFWAGITRIWIAWHHWRETEVLVLYDLLKKHGVNTFTLL
jgi:hypothetical protein